MEIEAVMEEEEPGEPFIDFVPALCFLARGVARERPEKIVLTQEELARVIADTREELQNDEDDENEDSEADGMDVDDTARPAPSTSHNANEEINFDTYDEEANAQYAHISNIVDDQVPDNDDEDSEDEDERLKPTDNILLVGRVQDDGASMEVWVFNGIEESLYTHHDFLLPSSPLCIEWLNHDPGSDKPGNMCAIGCMDPIITLWDLDIMDSIEPTFKLGSKGNRKKQKEKYGHKDAVLDLSWNRHFEHILASGSVDQTLILWDLDEGKPHTTITAFTEKVQSLEFHPTDAQSILSGCADGLVRLFDCRNVENVNSSVIKWQVQGGEIEKVLWNPVDANYFVVGTNDGSLHYADRRRPEALLWSNKAHDEEISGICFNTEVPNLLTSTSTDGALKVWNFNASEIKSVYTHDMQMGRLQCMKQSPDDPFTLAFGGEKSPRCRIYNIKNFEAVRRIFNIPDAE